LNYVGTRYLKFEETGDYFIKAGADSPENLLAFGDFDNTEDSKSWAPHLHDWRDGDPVWQGEKGKGLIGAVNYLASQGMNAFSFLTMNVNGDGGDVWPWAAANHEEVDGNDNTDIQNRMRYDVSKLEQWEILFTHADSLGMFLHFKTQETENDQLLDEGELGPQRKLYYRELIARFGHHLALNWNLGEEFDLYEELSDPENLRAKSYAQYFRDIDPYAHHVVIHSYPDAQDLLYNSLLGDSAFSGASIQSHINSIHDDIKLWVEASSEAGKDWAVSGDEQGDAHTGVAADFNYEGNRGSQPDNRAEVRQKVLWGTLMAGGFGVEYYFGYQTGVTDLNAEDWRSRKTKWEDAKIAIDFFKDHLPYWNMETSDDLISGIGNYCFAKLSEIYAVYLADGGEAHLDLSDVAGTYTVQWFDPRNGGALAAGSVPEISGGGAQSLGTPPDASAGDWVALVKKKPEEPSEEEIPVITVEVSPKTLSLLAGSGFQLAYIVSPDSAANTNVSWASSAPEIVNVDSTGLLYAQSPGEAIIKVYADNDKTSDSTQVTVIPRRVKPRIQTGPQPRLNTPPDLTLAPVDFSKTQLRTTQRSTESPAIVPTELHSPIPGNLESDTAGNENSLQIVPNPASRTGTVQFTGLEDGYYELGLYSIQGQLISNEQMEIRDGFYYNLQLRDPGLILVRIQGRDGTYLGKLVVN
jgi:hypothetical protein